MESNVVISEHNYKFGEELSTLYEWVDTFCDKIVTEAKDADHNGLFILKVSLGSYSQKVHLFKNFVEQHSNLSDYVTNKILLCKDKIQTMKGHDEESE